MDPPGLAPFPWLGPAKLQTLLPQLGDPGSLVFLFLGAGCAPGPTTPSPHTSSGPWLGQAYTHFPSPPGSASLSWKASADSSWTCCSEAPSPK